MKTSEQGINLIKKYEGFKAKPYLCPANVPTIGYGTTVYPSENAVKLTDKAITKNKALEYLQNDVIQFEQTILRLVKVELRQSQFDALVSLVYNIGGTAFKASTLLKKINNNPDDGAIELEFLKWTKARVKGVLTTLKGLEFRRSDEAMLYFMDTDKLV